MGVVNSSLTFQNIMLFIHCSVQIINIRTKDSHDNIIFMCSSQPLKIQCYKQS